MTRAAARAPRNAPVRFTSMTWRQTAASVSRGPATIGEIPALQIQASTPPHSATAASATASLKSSSVTSPLSTRDAPGRTGLRERVAQHGAEAAARTGDDHPLARDRSGDRERLGYLDLLDHRFPH